MQVVLEIFKVITEDQLIHPSGVLESPDLNNCRREPLFTTVLSRSHLCPRFMKLDL